MSLYVGEFSATRIRLIFLARNTAAGPFICAQTPVSVHSWLTRISSIKSIGTLKKANKMWKPGDIISWRGIYRERIWHVQPTILVKDSSEEVMLTLLPGTECIAEMTYPKGKKNGQRRWYFVDHEWQLARYKWKTNRLLLIFEPKKYYSIILFWNQTSDDFLCYYVNFQLPFERNQMAIDTLDLDLDLIIHPDFSYEWKDEDDYQQAITHGLILPKWSSEIELATDDVLERLEKRDYPFDGSWRDWKPDPGWLPPRLPQDWDVL